jgi:hypothetical protein
MKIMVYNLLSTCTSAALCSLAVLSAVKAKEHTIPSGGSLDDYNSSACAVSAVWLIFAIWFVSLLIPQFPSLVDQDLKHSPSL